MTTLTESSRKLVNFIVYYIGWFAAVTGAASGDAGPGIVTALLILVTHAFLLREQRGREFMAIASIALLGSCVDALFARVLGVTYTASSPTLIPGYPLWMTGLWAGFATTLSLSLRWIDSRYLWGAILGAIGGPISLIAGIRLGAASAEASLSTVIIVSSLEWAITIPLILSLRRRLTSRF